MSLDKGDKAMSFKRLPIKTGGKRLHTVEHGLNAALNPRYSPAAHLSTDLVRMAYERGLSPMQFADLAKRMDGDRDRILTVLRGL